MSRCLVFPILAIVISRAGAAPAPAEAAGRLEDFIHLTLVENHLRIDWLSNLQPPRQPLHLLGPEARWELRMPAPIRGVAPMTLQLQRPPSGTRDRQSYWYVHVSSSPDQLSILAHRGGRGAAAANTLRFGQSFDGSVHLVAIDNVTRKFAQASAADLVALRAQHPQLVRDWLVPLLRQLAGEDPLLPGAADAYRVFDEFSADPEIERRVRELLPRLADGDYQIREAASRRIAQLGPQIGDRPLGERRQHPVTEMLRVQIPGDVHDAIDEEHPRCGEVVIASPPPVAEGAGLLPREAPVCEPERRRIPAISRIAPVQLREIEKDVDTAPQQVDAGNEVDPVADPNVVRMSRAHQPAFYDQCRASGSACGWQG